MVRLAVDNGAALRELLTVNKNGYCSSDIAIVSRVIEEYNKVLTDFNFVCSSYSSDIVAFLNLIINRTCYRQKFLQALRDNNLSYAKAMLYINPYLLHIYEGEYESDEAKDLLLHTFLSVSSTAVDYKYMQELLYECCFDFNMSNDLGQSLLCLLIMDQADHQKYRDLLKVGVNVNTLDNSGKSPLWYAGLSQDKDKVDALLWYGAVVSEDILLEQFALPLWKVLYKTFYKQICHVCKLHPTNLSHIPCVNRHMRQFICKNCYDNRTISKKCPICYHALGDFGA